MSIVASLEREAEERNNAQASGLAGFIKSYRFVASLHMYCDILPLLANLSRAFPEEKYRFFYD